VRDDAAALARLLGELPPQPDVEVIVSATDADDAPLAPLRAERRDVVWVRGSAGRGVQLNRGAARARGGWIWFVHADSQLPSAWREEFARLEGAADVAGGSFAFALDSTAWQARVIERAVRWRVRRFSLPYGDQGLFARREVFEQLGGFAPLPLMEDVEFVRRLNRRGRMAHLKTELRTSARRWERDGWWRRSAGNLVTLGLYGFGMSPNRLAALYDRPDRRTGP
jgi:rSAM/selenodomain-associated transferase 2